MNQLISFLNSPARTVAGEGILTRWYNSTSEADWQRLRSALTALVAPDNLVPTTAPKHIRDEFRHLFIGRYLTPANVLQREIIPLLNKHVGKPTWRLSAAKNGPVKIRGFSGSVGSDDVWLAVGRLLESGEISFLGQCLVCSRFFAKARYKQVCCGKPAPCGKIYDNRKRIELKAEARRRKRDKQIQQQRAQEKNQIRKVFQENIIRHLPGGPGQRHKAIDAYLKKLDAAPTRADFINQLPTDIRKVLKQKYFLN